MATCLRTTRQSLQSTRAMRNRAFNDLFEPGRRLAFKPAVALETAKSGPRRQQTAPGQWVIGTADPMRSARNRADRTQGSRIVQHRAAQKWAGPAPPNRCWASYAGRFFGTQPQAGFPVKCRACFGVFELKPIAQGAVLRHGFVSRLTRARLLDIAKDGDLVRSRW